VFGVKESLIAEVKEVNDPSLGKARDLPAQHAEINWDFILDR